MEHSKAYGRLIDQISVIGTKESGSYPLCTIDELYDRERDEMEDLIWNTFHKTNDLNLAKFLPKLKNYDGLDALRKMLPEWNIPSKHSLTIAIILYEYTNESKYFDIVKSNIEKDRNNLPYISILSYAKPDNAIYRLLANIYISNKDKIIRTTAITGVLYNKGFINNPHDLQETINKVELRRMFRKDNEEERKDMINRLEAGEFDGFK